MQSHLTGYTMGFICEPSFQLFDLFLVFFVFLFFFALIR